MEVVRQRWYSFFTSEILLVIAITLFGLVVRSSHFVSYLNFSTDQAVFSLRAWELWERQEFTLVGPTASFAYEGRFLIQSSVIFYTTLLFLLFGQFDPVWASWAFMIMAVALLPLAYGGLKKLVPQPWAVLLYMFLALGPWYVTHTRFLWNPNYQLAGLPVLLFCWGKMVEKKTRGWVWATGVVAGFLSLYHYQFVLVTIVLTAVLWWTQYWRWSEVFVWSAGVLIGFSPMVAFELNSGFYLTQTVWLILHNAEQVFSGEKAGLPLHYVLSISYMFLVMLSRVLATKGLLPSSSWVHRVMIVGLIGLGLWQLVPTPVGGYGMPPNWSYAQEYMAHRIISQQQVTNFAVVNTLYETTASVQYYLLTKKEHLGFTKDYRTNDYLFVIAPRALDLQNLVSNSAYELNTFKPSRLENVWQLSPDYSLYLLKRAQ